MIVRAVFSRAQGAASARRTQLHLLVCLLSGLIASRPAEAQVAGSIGIDSDYRFRGDSLTNGRPALSGEMTYDDPSGVYFSLSALSELSRNKRFLGVIGNVGYAERLSEHATLDFGLLRSQIRASGPETTGFNYTEVYVGAYVGPVSGRVYYSPDYETGSGSTIYGELEAGFEPVPDWRLSGHIGLLKYLTTSDFHIAGGMDGDWRMSIARQVGRLEIHAALSGGGSNNYYGYEAHKKAAFTIGSSIDF